MSPQSICSKNIDSITDELLTEVNAFKPTYTEDEGLEKKQVITNTKGEEVGLVPNQISKVRIYIWLEGQDPDCIDLASTGDKLNVNLKFTKEKTEQKDDNSYSDEEDEGQEPEEEPKLTASQVTANEYGKYVSNYHPTNSSNVGWRIFHSDGTNIYLIADNYSERGKVPKTAGGASISTNTSKLRAFGFANIVNGYNGSSDITETHLARSLLQKFQYSSENANMKVTAYLMDTTRWNGFEDGTYAKYAIGSPTLELFADSYNKTHSDKTIETQVVDVGKGHGYDVKWNDGSFGTYSISGLDSKENLYVIENTSAMGIWLASPSAEGAELMTVVTDLGLVDVQSYTDKYYGVRPVVALNENMKIQKQDDGKYMIVE